MTPATKLTGPDAAPAHAIEGQRYPDLSDGQYLNPILAGDRPDPSVLKDGSDYYMVHSSFFSYPGLLVWHSKDLVNWRPLRPTLRKHVGSVWAPDLVKHDGRYYIYFPGLKTGYLSNYVIWSDHTEGPWSDPIDLKIGQIDPGRAVGRDGQRYLFLSGGFVTKLAADGLSAVGAITKVYDGWRRGSGAPEMTACLRKLLTILNTMVRKNQPWRSHRCRQRTPTVQRPLLVSNALDSAQRAAIVAPDQWPQRTRCYCSVFCLSS